MRIAIMSQVFTLVAATAALADVAPPPGYFNDRAAQIITKAGFDCPSVTSLALATSPESDAMIWGGNRPQIATCSNGKRFLVASPPRRFLWGSLSDEVPPTPPPPSVIVKPL